MSTHVFVYLTISLSLLIFHFHIPTQSNSQKDLFQKEENEIFWFVHISDLHISHQKELKERRKLIRFKKLVKTYIPFFRPKFVIASGDITHALTHLRSNQVLYEWESYSNVLKNNNYYNSTFWMDTKGNHDVFNDQVCHFNDHLSSGNELKNKRVYSKTYKVNHMKYKVIAIDSTPRSKFMRLLSMFGELNQSDLDEIEDELNGDQDVTIMFTHYPSRFIHKYKSTSGLSLYDLLKKYNVQAFLCGHIHNVYGYGNEAQIIQNEGNLELEVADFGSNNIMRLVAFDKNRLSFVDFNPFLNQTVILITNPKDSRFLITTEYDMLNTKYIRFLVFSFEKIHNIQVSIDGKIQYEKIKEIEPNLYAMKWNPNLYSEGFHEIQVHVTNHQKEITTKSQTFSLDGSILITWSSMIPRFLLQVEWTQVLIIEFFLLHLYIIHLIYFNKIHLSMDKRKELLIISIYMIIGPWLIYEVKDHIFGLAFPWGIITNESNFYPWRAETYFGYFIFFEIFTFIPYVIFSEKYPKFTFFYMLWRFYASFKYFSLYSLSLNGKILGMLSPIGPLFFVLIFLYSIFKK